MKVSRCSGPANGVKAGSETFIGQGPPDSPDSPHLDCFICLTRRLATILKLHGTIIIIYCESLVFTLDSGPEKGERTTKGDQDKDEVTLGSNLKKEIHDNYQDPYPTSFPNFSNCFIYLSLNCYP